MRRGQVKVARMVHQWLVKRAATTFDLPNKQDVVTGIVAANVVTLEPGGAIGRFEHGPTAGR